ncbi:Na/Pi cotransporter family protein [Natronospira bacteriovora]|uniref:Na/Pi symporter n=1 Tax=Natronospira bacteriovora TaxID=3069753 RepID=A0ABU0W9E6_9GAMM|nr:Na/Pi symporter [Natronospira sp. AB-CW4]MDQ2070651.1 Na/Pi symporter [Natronospira sp. AB-CW4]
MNLWQILSFLGGVGLFLLGMKLMTEGLKVAAGDGLRHVLAFATRSRARGLASGAMITGVVQSSSAVIFATIGFVNAGILGLGQAVGVIYGANLGTTATTWLVSVVGLEFSLKAFALPFIGAGMLIRLLARVSRLRGLGDAVTGFGVFFLGLDVLTDMFRETGPMLTPAFTGSGALMLFLHLLAGFLMTVVMQSSSAALAVILTAATGGALALPGAAAMMIGANLGTTSTAVFAALGATPNARRVASSHVIFNVVEAAILFLFFGFLLQLVQWLAASVGMAHSIAVALAFFHTTGKLIGLMAMWPLTPLMVDWLSRRFRPLPDELARPQYLDETVLATPSLGLRAVEKELNRALVAAGHLFTDAIAEKRIERARLEGRQQALQSLLDIINDAAQSLSSHDLSSQHSRTLPDVLRTTRYLEELGERALELDEMARRLPAICPVEEGQEGPTLSELARAVPSEPLTKSGVSPEFEERYQRIKSELLWAGASRRMGSRQMSDWLDYFSVLRRAAKVHGRACQHAALVASALHEEAEAEH